MDGSTMTLEQQLQQASEQVRELEAEASEKKLAADTLAAEYREKGVNPFSDKDAFEAVDAAYLEADKLSEQASEIRQQSETLMQRLGRKTKGEEPRRRMLDAGEGESPAERLMSSPEYKRLLETNALKGAGGRIEIPPIEIATREQVLKAFRGHTPLLHAATADVDAMVAPDLRLFPPVGIPVRAMRVLDLITVGTTDSDLVKYVVEKTRTDAAAETERGTAYSEATYEYEPAEAPVRDIGHFTPAHRDNLADQGQVQALLEGRLQMGVELRFESQLVSGNGVGQNLTGILNTDGIGHVNRDGTNDERLLEVIHRSITAVRLAFFGEPDAIGIHPSSYEQVVFEKDSNTGQYLLGPASQATSRTIWGFPAVVSSVFPEDTALTGAYRAGAVAWIRAGVSVRASDSHEDFFTRRMVALLAEMRAAAAAWQPLAFCEADLS